MMEVSLFHLGCDLTTWQRNLSEGMINREISRFQCEVIKMKHYNYRRNPTDISMIWDKNDKNLVKFFKIFMFFSGAKQPGSRRLRTAYTNTQLIELEKEFYLNKYLCR